MAVSALWSNQIKFGLVFNVFFFSKSFDWDKIMTAELEIPDENVSQETVDNFFIRATAFKNTDMYGHNFSANP